MNEYDRLRVRVWYRCAGCNRLSPLHIIAGNSIVQNIRYFMRSCPTPTDGSGLCRLRLDGDYELCTGRKDSNDTLIFAGDRIGPNDQTWAEVTWNAEKGQWYAGDPLWLELERGAKVVGNSHEPVPEDKEEEPQNEDKQ